MEKQREDLRERLSKDDEFLEDLVNNLKERNVEVVDHLKTDISAEYVFIKLLDKVKNHMVNRTDLIEKELA